MDIMIGEGDEGTGEGYVVDHAAEAVRDVAVDGTKSHCGSRFERHGGDLDRSAMNHATYGIKQRHFIVPDYPHGVRCRTNSFQRFRSRLWRTRLSRDTTNTSG